jgi:hypothetical protein
MVTEIVAGTTYEVAVSGMTSNGTVIASVVAAAAQDVLGNGSLASTSTDNVVSYTLDMTPDAFTVADKTDVAASTLFTSDPVIISGLGETTVPISMTVGNSAQFRVNGTLYPAGTTGITVGNGATVIFYLRSPEAVGDQSSTTITVGGYSTTWTLTTGNDNSPKPLVYKNITNATLGKVYTTATAKVLQLNVPASISITGDSTAMFSVNGVWYDASAIGVTVQNNDLVSLRVTAPSAVDMTVQVFLTVGSGVTTTWSVSTVADSTPDAFTFTDVTNADFSKVYISGSRTMKGFNTDIPISVTGDSTAMFSVNGTWYDASATGITVKSGDAVALRLASSATGSTAVTATLTTGSYSTTWTVTTKP